MLAPAAAHEPASAPALIVVLGFLFVTVSSRLTGEIGSSSNPISGMTVATLLLTCLVFLVARLDRAGLLRHGALGRRHRLHRLVERRHDVAGSEDRIPRRRHAAQPADRDPHRRAASRRWCSDRSCSSSTTSATVYVPRVSKEPVDGAPAATLRDVENFPATLRVDPATLTDQETYQGTEYLVWHKQSTDDGPAGKYLVDDERHAGLSRRSGHQRHASLHRRTASGRWRSSTRRRRR